MEDFSPEEKQKLRAMLEAQARAEWFWQQSRIWVTWISAAIVGTYAVYETLFKFVRGLSK